jgi:hypothetical protein
MTTVAVALVAFIAACVAHEVVGHGGACLVEGGDVTLLSTVYFRCQGGGVVADLGGPLANLVLGVACLTLLRGQRWSRDAKRLLVLGFAFNFLWLAGCMLWSSIAGQSDFAYAVHLLGPAEPAMRVVVGFLGLVLARSTVRVVARQGLSRTTLRVSYVTAGVASGVSVLFFVGPVLPALWEAALEGFGAMAWLLFVPNAGAAVKPDAVQSAGESLPAWLAISSVTAMSVFLLLGRGYQLPQTAKSSIERAASSRLGPPSTALHLNR